MTKEQIKTRFRQYHDDFLEVVQYEIKLLNDDARNAKIAKNSRAEQLAKNGVDFCYQMLQEVYALEGDTEESLQVLKNICEVFNKTILKFYPLNITQNNI